MIWPLNVIQCQRSWGELKDHTSFTICVSYVYTLVITCIISEILTQTDRKGQNRTFRPWKMTWKAIQWNPPFYRSSILSRGSTMSKYRKFISPFWRKSTLKNQPSTVDNPHKTVSNRPFSWLTPLATPTGYRWVRFGPHSTFLSHTLARLAVRPAPIGEVHILWVWRPS